MVGGNGVILQPKTKKRMMNSLSLLNAIIIRLQGAAGSDKACM